tara:strand:- start:2852 stop:3673 length:822 start_codon:yes stop_codon:yes gene_type:complete
MLAASKTPELDELNYPLLASPKLDGIRCIVADGIPFSRNMKRIPNLCIQQTIMKLEQHGLDGELMIAGGFESVASGVMSITGIPDFYLNVFDDFSIDQFGFWDRYRKTKDLVEALDSPFIRMVEHKLINNAKELKEFWDWCIYKGYEGAMVRSLNGPYKRGRSTIKQGYLIKLKLWHDDEAKIVGFEELMNNEDAGNSKKQENLVPANTLGALVVQWMGLTFKVGSGFNMELRNKIWQNKEKYQGAMVTFKYQELTTHGVPRFPIFKTVREDV